MSLRSALRGMAESVLVRLPRTTKPGDRLILAYHNVVPNDWVPRGDLSLHMPLHKFEAQLKMIKNEAEIVPLMEILTQDAPNDRRVAITFDDAYASAMELGVGACVAAGAASTVFVAPALLGTTPVWDSRANTGSWSDEERRHFLWQQQGRNVAADHPLDAVQDPVLTIATKSQLDHAVADAGPRLMLGNHSMTHANLGALSVGDSQQELSLCDAWLLAHEADRYVPVAAYPYGIAPKDAAAAVAESRIQFGLLAAGGWRGSRPGSSTLAAPRYNVSSGVSAEGFATRLRGRLLGE